jgi:mono/diheme cytochrome c family protein
MLDVMRFKLISFRGNFLCALAVFAVIQLLVIGVASAQPQPGTLPPPPAFVPPPPPTGQQPSPLELLKWDSVLKEMTPQPGQAMADFVFSVSNPTEQNVTIDHVHTSCGCTVAKLPSQPWVLVPHTNGQINVTVNLMGKQGTIWKTITVYSTNNIQKILTVKINIPESPEAMRLRNRAMASQDPQAIFKGDCAKCHVDKSIGLMGKQLYKESCGICHEATPRATMVPDLHALPHPADYAYWEKIISEGKPHTMMPGFSVKHGGPLTDEQVESLAKVLTQAFSPGSQVMPVVPAPNKTSSAGAPVQTANRLPLPPIVPVSHN